MLLLGLLLILIFGVLVIHSSGEKNARYGALAVSVASFLYSVLLLLNHSFLGGFQGVVSAPWISDLGITFTVGLDAISLFFVLLTTFLMPVVILSTWHMSVSNARIFYICLGFIEFFLVLSFSALDLFLFYFSFESVLIPMITIIILGGRRSRKIRAAFLFFFYTLIGSFFMLASILYIHANFGTTSYLDIIYSGALAFSKKEQLFLWVGFFFAFAAKVPMYPFHLWLPEAHVEAPTSGSMILAGLLLKLGGYGFIRFSIGLFPYASAYYSPFIYALAALSVVYASCCALVQIDFKKLIAYSSIAHMNMAVLGIFSGNVQGLTGGYILMLGHGLVSTALFFLVGCLYDRHHERTMDYYGGLSQVVPVFSFFFFYFIICNFGFPAGLSFLGEVFVVAGVYKLDFFVLLVLGAGLVIGLCYNILFYEKMFLGTLNTRFGNKFMDMTKREILVILPLFLFNIIFLIKPFILTHYLGHAFHHFLFIAGPVS